MQSPINGANDENMMSASPKAESASDDEAKVENPPKDDENGRRLLS
jgi:hypothetical protein